MLTEDFGGCLLVLDAPGLVSERCKHVSQLEVQQGDVLGRHLDVLEAAVEPNRLFHRDLVTLVPVDEVGALLAHAPVGVVRLVPVL